MGSQSNGVDWANEPIAIIGMSCKFGSDATSPEKLWEMVSKGGSAWSEIPSSRFNWKGSYHPDSERRGTTHVTGGHFMEEDIGLFDAAFFNYSAETASSLDPSFRLQLESAYEALENAGLPLHQVAGSKTSVYAGVFFHDYKDAMIRDEDNIPRLYATGTGSAMASNRISHFFDLRGPSMTIDTGCSTTLTALHQAVQGLRLGEADMSIVGGANVLLNPDWFKAFSSLGMVSADGRSYAFDSRASGYGRGEGVATVVIKRLRDAIASGDVIRAVIRETMLNQDGKTETITTPSSTAQESLIRECYNKAGLDPADTQYFEAHGTGTPAGDPIEMGAVVGAFINDPNNARLKGNSKRKTRTEPLRIGSVKTNLGHTETTSGLASVIKVALALEHGVIPPTVNFEKLNPKIGHLDEKQLKVATELESWPVTPDAIRRASINNFGYGGSNAHIIMENAETWLQQEGGITPGASLKISTHDDHNDIPQTVLENGTSNTSLSKVLVLSARDEQGCQRTVENVKLYLQNRLDHSTATEDEELLLQRLVYTMGERRTLFPWVAAHAIPCNQGINGVIEVLGSAAFKPLRTSRRPRIGLVFTGQGAQWYAMGRELLGAYPAYKASINEASGYLTELGATWSLEEELTRGAETSRVNDVALATAICVAVQISLVHLLQTWGVRPVAVTSHSSGEIAAAYTVGALTYRSAMAVAYYRGVLVADKSLHGPVDGGMIALGLGIEDVQMYLDRIAARQGEGGQVRAVAACINSPSSVTVSGDLDAINDIETMAKADKVFARRLRVQTAYHSHHMAPIAYPYLSALRNTISDQEDPTSVQGGLHVAFSSPVTGGRVVELKDISCPEYWVESLLQPVQFVDAFTDMVLGDFDPSGSSVDILIEIGPHTALGGPIQQALALPEFSDVKVSYYGSLVRNKNAVETMQDLSANLLKEGYPLDMGAVNFPLSKSPHISILSDLPSYPWNHQTRHWAEPRLNRALRERQHRPHELLGSLVLGTNPEVPSWRNILRLSQSPWLRDHVVQSNILYPGAGYICLAIEGISRLVTSDRQVEPESDGGKCKTIAGYKLRNVDLHQALVVAESSEGTEILTTLYTVSEKDIGSRGWKRFNVSSVTQDNKWTEHATGLIMVEYQGLDHISPRISAQQREVTGYVRHVDPADMYEGMRAAGIAHGPKFRNMKKITQSGKEMRSVSNFIVAEKSSSDEPDGSSGLVLHPTTLDSVIQAAYTALPGAGSVNAPPMVPKSIAELWISGGISSQASHKFTACSRLDRQDQQSFQGDVSIVDQICGDDIADSAAVLEMKGLICQSLGISVSPGSMSKTWEKEICSKLEWAADLSLASADTWDNLRKQLSYGSCEPQEAAVILELRRVCMYFVQDAVNALTAADVAQLEKHHTAFYQWMQQQIELTAAGKMGPGSADWLREGPLKRQLHIEKAALDSVNGEMTCRVGPRLIDVLCHNISPLELMMEEKLLYRYYQECIKLDRSFVQLVELFRLAVHKSPRARILEIGAGTGGATRHMLKVLGESGASLGEMYHFTDISSGFFEDARGEFAPWIDIMAFDKLDIGQDPVEQGFILGSYDIVISCQCLHATATMSETMSNVRKLMKPGGSLLLIETTNDQLDVQFAFGLLPGWWLGAQDGRTSSPSLSEPLWDEVLRKTGFTGLDLGLRDCEDDGLYSSTTILSRSLPHAEASDQVTTNEVVIITDNKDSPPSDLLSLLRNSMMKATGGQGQPNVYSLADCSSAVMFQGRYCVFVGELDKPLLHNLDHDGLAALKALATGCNGLLWVTRGGAVACEDPNLSMAPGFLRTLRNEYVGRRYVSLDLDPSRPAWCSESIQTIVRVVKASLDLVDDTAYSAAGAAPTEFEYAERAGVVMIPRYYKDQSRNNYVSQETSEASVRNTSVTELLHQETRSLKLEVGVPGQLDSLVFSDDIPTYDEDELADDCLEIEPRAYGVNFRDVMLAMGQLHGHTDILGIECAGIVRRVGRDAGAHGFKVGDRVFCMRQGFCKSRLRVEWLLAAHIPPNFTFEDAAALPVVFGTAYIGLYDVAGLQAGQSVLIHAASGGVGQAAIMLAQRVGADVFVTAGTAEKRQYLMDKYGIPANRVYHSRDASFGTGILRATSGRGVDVVLNSLAGPLLQESFRVLAPYGHFIEIGKRDILSNNHLEMGSFIHNTTFAAVDLHAMLCDRHQYVHRIMTGIERLAELGSISAPKPVTVFPMADASTALRHLQTGKHMGKAVVSAGPREMVPVVPQARIVKFPANESYLLVGGVGGIGRSVAHWMVAHGAKNLILLSRSAASSEKTGAFISELQEAGCRVIAVSCDVADEAGLAEALCASERELPPIRGIIHGGMVLQDSILEQMTLDDYTTAFRPKVKGSWNLHNEFTRRGRHLDFFIMLSSLAGIIGHASQSNYSASGAYQDALARYRVGQNLPGVSIDVGIVKSVGYVAERADVAERMARLGYMPISEDQVLRVLESAILEPCSPQVLVGLQTGPGRVWEPNGESQLGRDSRFAALRHCQTMKIQQKTSSGARSDREVLTLSDKLAEATSRDDAETLVSQAIAEKLSTIFMIPIGEIDPTTKLSHYGVDSLVAQ
ncbi:Lovastatin diketide synthase LovF [Cytospora mali]|uniref:Lovastatin diketide synthase LovF n=1 Tax=Cytospora mali TaxID=578113 RepID=A0A194UPC3_CYTMA|nr:Lovastatin diketide synthase LovF [Valsa mali var. pyri (nom. inval.)]